MSRNIDLPDYLTRAVRIASMEAGVSGNALIVAATAASIQTMADHSPRLLKMLKAADAIPIKISA
jgi:hypothetical protein